MRDRLGVLAVLLSVAALGGCRRQAPWNVLLVTFDTTRADRIGAYGRASARTPNVDALARDGVVFENTYSSVPLTAPSHSTILTGKLPLAHGVRDNSMFVLPPSQVTLAEVLRARGYRTAAAIGGFPLVARYGMNQGFELFDDRLGHEYETLLGVRVAARQKLFYEERKAGRVNEAVWDWLGEHGREPFFLWVHYYDPHQPHEPPPPFDQLHADDLYDGEISYADDSLGTLLRRIRDLGVEDRTLVVFTSDHGEGLGEHNELTHSYLLYDTTLRVPLVLRVPAGPKGLRVTERARLVDVLPTVLDFLGIPVPVGVQGRSLAPALRGETLSERPLYAETLSPRLSQNMGEMRALLDGRYKYVHGPRPELFDLAADPRELLDLAATRPDLALEMKAKLASFIRAHAAPPGENVVPLDEETRRQLMALGYLTGSASDAGSIREELRSDGVPPQDRAADATAMTQAKLALEQGRPFEARHIASLLLKESPDDPYFLAIYAAGSAQLGEFPEALEAIDRVLAQGPARSAIEVLLLDIARAYHHRGDRAEAEKLARRSLAVKPSPAAHYFLACVAAEQGRGDDEMRALEEALGLDPDFTPARVDRAVRLAQRGDRAAAEKEFGLALSGSPYDANARYNYGTFRLENGDVEGALSQFERAVVLAPEYARAHYAVVALLVRSGRRQDALRKLGEFAAVVRAGPELDAARKLLEETP